MSSLTKRIACLIFISLSLVGSVSPALAAITYTYDANGNMTSDGTQCYEYNQVNQLAKVTNCGTQTIAEYVYDYEGNRIAKKEYENGNLKHTIYSPDKEFEVKKPVSGAEEKTNYIFANNELVARKNNDGSKVYYQNDHLGSATLITNQNGTVLENTTYFPFGDIRSGGTKSKYLYTGQERDAAVGLSYYNARYYNSHTAHFTQPDTILPDPYDPQQLNRYAYVRNNPLKYTDPSGHFLQAFITAIGAAVGAQLEGWSQIRSYSVANNKNYIQTVSDPNFRYDYGRLGAAAVGGGLTTLTAMKLAPIAVGDIGGILFSAGNILGNPKMASQGVNMVAAAQNGFMGFLASNLPRVTLSLGQQGPAAQHVKDAQAAGYPSVLTIDRANVNSQRTGSLKGTPTFSGLDRDEYPPAMFREGGSNASINYIDPSANRSAGSCLMYQCRNFSDGTRVLIDVTE